MLRFTSRTNVRRTLVLATAIAVGAAVAAPTSPAAAASKPKVIRIGALLSITGSGSTLGKSSRAALEVARDAWNAKLNKQGKSTRVVLDVFDTGLDPARAMTGFDQLAAKGARIIIGPQSSSEVAAIRDAAQSKGVLLVSQGSTASSLAFPDDNIFRFVPTDHVEGRAITDLMLHEGAKAIVPMWRNDRGNNDVVSSVRSAAATANVPPTAGVRYEPDTTDFGPALAELAKEVDAATAQVGAANVAVYLAGFEEVAKVLDAASAMPDLAAVRWYGADGSAEARELVDDRVADQFAVHVRGYPNPLVALPANRVAKDAPLLKLIQKQSKAAPDAFTLAAYDAFDVGVRTLLAVGADADAATLRSAFAKTADGYHGLTGTMQLDATGDRVSAPYAFWSICAPSSGPGVWTRTGGWVPAADAGAPGTVSGGGCPA